VRKLGECACSFADTDGSTLARPGDDFLKIDAQSQSRSKQCVQGGTLNFLFDITEGLTRETGLLSKQVEGKTALLPFLFQEAGDF